MTAPQYQASFLCRRASPGSRYLKRGASANALAKTLAAEGTWSARMKDIRASVMKHGGVNGQITDRGPPNTWCATGSPILGTHMFRYQRTGLCDRRTADYTSRTKPQGESSRLCQVWWRQLRQRTWKGRIRTSAGRTPLFVCPRLRPRCHGVPTSPSSPVEIGLEIMQDLY